MRFWVPRSMATVHWSCSGWMSLPAWCSPFARSGETNLILGIGIDLCCIARIQRSVDRLGGAWIEELFAGKERVQCVEALDGALAFARGFACKEACAKALGSGFAKGVHPRDIILSSRGGSWDIAFQGGARRRLRRITPPRHTARCRVTVVNTCEFLSCIVVIEAIPTARADGAVRRLST